MAGLLAAVSPSPAVAQDRSFPPASLTDAQLQIMVAAAAALYEQLPREPADGSGIAVDGVAVLGTAIDSVGRRGIVTLSDEEGMAIREGLESRGIPAKWCAAGCLGRLGEAALTFHVPIVHDDESVTIWILNFRAVGAPGSELPDRTIFRGDEIRLVSSSDGWRLVEHTQLRELSKEWDPPRSTVY